MPVRLTKYLLKLRTDANRAERIDINGKPVDSFLKKYQKRIICLIIAIIITTRLHKGFELEFVSYVSSVLSILVGLFITALIFCFDKFYTPQKGLKQDYELTIKNDTSESEKVYNINLLKTVTTNSKKKLWDIQSYNYAKQFSYVTGYNIVLAILALVLLSFSSIFSDKMSIDTNNYRFTFKEITLVSIKNFSMCTIAIIQRLLVLYWIGAIIYNTLFIVSSMVNFMDVKNNRSND